MFGISGFELFIILLFGFLIFGPDKLPEIAKTIGKGIAKFRSAQEDMSQQLKDAALFDKDSDTPFKNPIDVISNASEKAKDGAGKAREGVRKAAGKVAEHSEGFAERKARYERERAARKAAQDEGRPDAPRESVSSGKMRSDGPDNKASDEPGASVEPKADVSVKAATEEED